MWWVPQTSSLEWLGCGLKRYVHLDPVHVVSFGKSVSDVVTDLKMRSWIKVALNPVTSPVYERRERKTDTSTWEKKQVKMEQDWKDVATSQGHLSHQKLGEVGKTLSGSLEKEHGPANTFFKTSGLQDCDRHQVFSNCFQPQETHTQATLDVPLNYSLNKE